MSEKIILSKFVKEIYHVLDKKSGFIVNTMLFSSSAEAQRTFDAEINNKEAGTPLSQFPDDYVLVHDGSIIHTTFIDDTSGSPKVVTTSEVLDLKNLSRE